MLDGNLPQSPYLHNSEEKGELMIFLENLDFDFKEFWLPCVSQPLLQIWSKWLCFGEVLSKPLLAMNDL